MQPSGRRRKIKKEERDLSLEDRQKEIEGGTHQARRPKWGVERSTENENASSKGKG
jgi:hypothetical protein